MSLDTKFRPTGWDDVLGQAATKKILRRFVATGAGFRQSYLFAGAFGGGKCVTGGTLIPTNRGLVPISSLMGPNQIDPLGVEIIQEGGVSSAAAFTYRGGYQNTIKITTKLGFTLEGTPNHRIKVLEKSGNVVWRALGDLQPEDYACIVKHGKFGPGADLSGYSQKEPNSNRGCYPRYDFDAPLTLTPEWGRLMGYLIGDSYCGCHNSVTLSCAELDTKLDQRGLLFELCGNSTETPDKRRKSLVSIRCPRITPREFLAYAGVGYDKAGAKEVPWSILVSPREVVREFLRGYFEADGYSSNKDSSSTTKSYKLAQQLQLLLLQFGVVAGLSPKNVPDYGVYWNLTIVGTSRARFEEELGFLSERKTRILHDGVLQKHAKGVKRKISNVREVSPYQQQHIASFYKQLPRSVRSRRLLHVFQAQYGKCNCSLNVAQEAAKLGGTHFQELLAPGYYFDPIVKIEPSFAEVFDLNVPDGEMFAGNGFMNHNTTLARILARALLCPNPSPNGDPCDKCESCRSMLEHGTALNYTEIDAATHSGKDDMKKLVEEIQFASFSGNRRVYTLDESHQLSIGALDAILKPLEENIPGTDDKKMVCIFCTTEPERMRATILSRCAPAFVIQPVPPDEIAQRLAWICMQEQIPYDLAMLQLIAEATECHIRDALKAIEGVSMLGPINEANVRSYLHLDLNSLYMDVVENLGLDLAVVTTSIRKILERASPATCYEKLVEVIMLAYQASWDTAKLPFFWDSERLKVIGQRHGDNLLGFASRLASRPGKPSASMLLCDLGHLHHVGGSVVGEQPILASSAPRMILAAPPAVVSTPVIVTPAPAARVADIASLVSEIAPVTAPAIKISVPENIPVKSNENSGILSSENPNLDYGGVRVSPLAVRNGGRYGQNAFNNAAPAAKPVALELPTPDFCRLLELRILELTGERSGSTRCPDVDSP